MNKSLARTLLIALAALQALIPLVLIVKYGVNIPFWDEWSPNVAGLFIKAHNHQLGLSDLLAQHNEHRIFVFRIIYLILGWITHGNTIAVMVSGWLVVCLTSLGLLCLATSTFSDAASLQERLGVATEPRVLIPWLLCNLMLFSPSHWENWLWSMGLANVLPMCFIVWGLVFAASRMRTWPKLWLALILALLAMLSAGNGVLAWPMIGVMLAWSDSREELKAKTRMLGVWTGAFVLAVVLYAIGYHRVPAPGVPGVPSLGKIMTYNLAFLGNLFNVGNLADELTASVLFGLAIILLLIAAKGYFLYAYIKEHNHALSRALIVWLLVASYSIFNGIIASMFRASGGAEQALSSRYATFSMHAIVGLAFLVPLIADDLRRRASTESPPIARLATQLPAFLAGILALLLILEFRPMLQTFRTMRLNRGQGKAALLLFKLLPDNPQYPALITNDVPRIAELLPELNRLGYINPTLIDTNDASALQAMDPHGTPSRGRLAEFERVGSDAVKVSGWAIDPIRSKPADAVLLTFDTEKGQPIIFIVADMGVPRQEPVNDTGDETLLNSGWVVTFPIGRLPPSLRQTRINAWSLDAETGKSHQLENDFILNR